MKGNFGILMVIAAFYPLGLMAGGICCINDIDSAIGRLAGADDFNAEAEYSVSLPQGDEDVVYSVALHSDALPGDTLCEAAYLADWQLVSPRKDSAGFSAYLPGHHYRYGDHRLQEYHYAWDSIPFIVGRGGVQRNGRFAELLPQMLARQIRGMEADSTFAVRYVPDTVVSGSHVAAVEAVQRVRGYDGRYFSLFLDRESGMPLRLYNEYNPGQISEQSVTVVYTYPDDMDKNRPRSEEELVALYPEVFEKYRESNYRVENLRGLPMPAFSLPTTTGERYTRHKGDRFLSPTVVALLDPSVSTAKETVEALRRAVDSLPGETGLVMVFSGSNSDMIEEIAGALRPGEAILMSGRSLARDCGVSEYPVVIVASRDGIVRDVILGFNRNLGESVIQAVSLACE